MPNFSPEYLIERTKSIFKAIGATEEYSSLVAEHLVESNLVGFDSHGIIWIERYIEDIKNGRLKASAIPKIIINKKTIGIIDSNRGFGQVAANLGMNLAMSKAKKNITGIVGIINCNHIGRLGAYAEQAAKNNFIGLVFCNSSPVWVSPYGGLTKKLGTNPLALGIPRGNETSFLMDFATAIVAEGKVRVNYYENQRVPEGWILDKNGRSSQNPADLYDGGSILPFGGHKGYSISLAIDLICGALIGAGCTTGNEELMNNGVFMMAIDIESFTQVESFIKNVEKTLEEIKKTPPIQKDNEVRIPGELEYISKKKRSIDGIPISDDLRKKLNEIAQNLGCKEF